ncbi:hypothetical protein S1001342_00668 [Acetobacter pasteurianus subsp. pasteurianus]|uniref:Uncharacterized protein n=1 Tax=Acetobacter pasteurianus subsp. pasteurianus TaxID=481145 RepID=A0A1Y0Y494_ACEPA|nr:hypothetical protein S1001342_00668 [Acetobacter pasteurianus subsp. pasteurianus]
MGGLWRARVQPQQGLATVGIAPDGVGKRQQHSPQFCRSRPARAHRVTIARRLPRPCQTRLRAPRPGRHISTHFINGAALRCGIGRPRWVGNQLPQLFSATPPQWVGLPAAWPVARAASTPAPVPPYWGAYLARLTPHPHALRQTGPVYRAAQACSLRRGVGALRHAPPAPAWGKGAALTRPPHPARLPTRPYGERAGWWVLLARGASATGCAGWHLSTPRVLRG